MLIVLFFIALIAIPTTYAASQQINVDTRSNHKILITIYEAGMVPPVRITSSSMYKTTGPAGDFSFTFSTDKKKIDIKLELKNDDTTHTHTFTDVELSGEPIYINLFPPDNKTIRIGNPVQNITPNTTTENLTINDTNVTDIVIVNVTDNASIIIANDTNKTKFAFNFSITGYATKFYEKNSKIFYYILIIIGVIVGILIIIFIIRKIPKKQHFSPPPPIYSKRENNSSDKSLAEAEKKLRIAQEEIERIKNRNQALREAERKLEEDRIRLEKLKRGY